ncbi:MAG: type-F conjugative transfer system secretin TraK [Rhodospirillaceae bacterium]|nr:type-F conjugative transfer system secretin TraK [Rhodospirillaceae bacterium]MDE0379667.1 type-F conjugative transfer system secretin TraK [Rhodospirillales bacterium]
MTIAPRRRALLLALHLLCVGALALPLPAAAMQILDAADHAELAAEISATGVNRIAVAGDRIAKVVRAPGGFAVEHDASSGDLYLRPSAPDASGDPAGAPVTLFIGTEKGFTYRLTLMPVERDSAQILIRNADAARPDTATAAAPLAGRPHVAALVKLVRAVARREPLPGHAIETARGRSVAGLTLIETWRGPRFAALVLEADIFPFASGDSAAAGLVGTIGELPGAGRIAALWLAAPGTGPSGGRLAVAVVDAGARGGRR